MRARAALPRAGREVLARGEGSRGARVGLCDVDRVLLRARRNFARATSRGEVPRVRRDIGPRDGAEGADPAGFQGVARHAARQGFGVPQRRRGVVGGARRSRRARRVALGVARVRSAAPPAGAPGRPPDSAGSRQGSTRWAPFDASGRDAMGALVQMVTDRVDELLDTHLETQADWAPDAPNKESDAVAGIIVYLTASCGVERGVPNGTRGSSRRTSSSTSRRNGRRASRPARAPRRRQEVHRVAVRNLDLAVAARKPSRTR